MLFVKKKLNFRASFERGLQRVNRFSIRASAIRVYPTGLTHRYTISCNLLVHAYSPPFSFKLADYRGVVMRNNYRLQLLFRLLLLITFIYLASISDFYILCPTYV